MLLLSHCSLVVASCSSTFSYEAAFLSGGCDVMQAPPAPRPLPRSPRPRARPA